jgi:helicase MOV-10
LVFSTLMYAATVIDVAGGFDQADYIFIDEAGHADELEALMPLAGLLFCFQSVIKAHMCVSSL